MTIIKIASFLIPHGKNLKNPPDVQGTFLPHKGNIYGMLSDVFEKSEKECQLPIRFVMAPDGQQLNPARDLILKFINNPTMKNGLALAERLRDATTNTSGLGLLFIILGSNATRTKIVLSRFPADQGVLAEAGKGTLALEFIERIFLKNAASYKSVLYKGKSTDENFWVGSAIDKQLKGTPHQVAYYWIRDFLASNFETTSKAGTKRLAVALRDASRSSTDVLIQHELLALSMLLKGLGGQIVTIQEIFDRYNISQTARDAITDKLAFPSLINDTFIFDSEEFVEHAAYASVELHTGGILLAPPDRFESVFERVPVNPSEREYRFETTGRIVEEKVRGRR